MMKNPFTSNARERAIEALLDSPLAKEAEARAAQAIANRRLELAKERDAMERAAEKSFHEHQAAMAAAKAAVAEATAALTAARARMGSLDANRMAECHLWNMRVHDIECELRETAHPSLVEFIAWARDEHDAALRAFPPRESTTFRNPATGQVTVERGPRRVMPADRALALREAIAAAETLRLEPRQDKISDALVKLRASLPVIGAIAKASAND